ncbi:MAG TPA: RNA methyltransferase [Kiritimatiellia bacterium]|nr:RNA methyltransferase [Kiritimatiellia bacterium]
MTRVEQEGNLTLTSMQNPRVKRLVRLRKRSQRDDESRLLIEGYREIRRALDNQWPIQELYVCPEQFLGENEPALIEACRRQGGEIVHCSAPVFDKISYKDRPEGLLAVAPRIERGLDDLVLPGRPLLIVAEAIEKPGNLGSILRSADASGVSAVIVCDHCTDINNPNVVRSSVGTLFSVPVVEASTADTLAWLREKGIKILAATPHTDHRYTDVDMTQGVAVVVGTEKFGLSEVWMNHADLKVKIPMLGQIDSLNVACATTLLLYEAVRQRGG